MKDCLQGNDRIRYGELGGKYILCIDTNKPKALNARTGITKTAASMEKTSEVTIRNKMKMLDDFTVKHVRATHAKVTWSVCSYPSVCEQFKMLRWDIFGFWCSVNELLFNIRLFLIWEKNLPSIWFWFFLPQFENFRTK